MLNEAKNIILLLIVLSGIASCKKDKVDIPIGTLSATVDEKKTTFNFAPKAYVFSVPGGYQFRMYGYENDPAVSSTSLEIDVTSESMFAPGTYIENSADNPWVKMLYNHDLRGIYFVGVRFGSNIKPVTITISEINSSFVRGTFSGQLRGLRWDGFTIDVTFDSGVFYLPL